METVETILTIILYTLLAMLGVSIAAVFYNALGAFYLLDRFGDCPAVRQKGRAAKRWLIVTGMNAFLCLAFLFAVSIAGAYILPALTR